MTSLHWFLIALVIIAGLGYWNWQRSDQQVKRLQAEGFVITEDLKGTPRLLVDDQLKQVAVVGPSGFQRYDFSNIKKLELVFDRNAQLDENFRIKLSFVDSSISTQEIAFDNEWNAEEKLQALQKRLP